MAGEYGGSDGEARKKPDSETVRRSISHGFGRYMNLPAVRG